MGQWEKRKAEVWDTSHTGHGERGGYERPTLGHSPLGWLGENATAHYMLASVLWMNNAQLCYPAAPLAILLHDSEAPDIAAVVVGQPTASVLIKQPSLMQIQVYALKQKHCMNLLKWKESRNRRLLYRWSEENKGIMGHLCEEHNDVCSLLSAQSSLSSLKGRHVANR